MGTGYFGKRHLEKIYTGYRKIIIPQGAVYFYKTHRTAPFDDDI
jgi:hypothetical protein